MTMMMEMTGYVLIVEIMGLKNASIFSLTALRKPNTTPSKVAITNDNSNRPRLLNKIIYVSLSPNMSTNLFNTMSGDGINVGLFTDIE